MDANKTELFSLLAEHIQGISVDVKQVCSTFGENVLSSPIRNLHKELLPAQTKMPIRASLSMLLMPHIKMFIIRSSDNDVVVIAVSYFHDLCLEELWIFSGSSKAHKYIPVHLIAQHLALKSLGLC